MSKTKIEKYKAVEEILCGYRTGLFTDAFYITQLVELIESYQDKPKEEEKTKLKKITKDIDTIVLNTPKYPEGVALTVAETTRDLTNKLNEIIDHLNQDQPEEGVVTTGYVETVGTPRLKSTTTWSNTGEENPYESVTNKYREEVTRNEELRKDKIAMETYRQATAGEQEENKDWGERTDRQVIKKIDINMKRVTALIEQEKQKSWEEGYKKGRLNPASEEVAKLLKQE